LTASNNSKHVPSPPEPSARCHLNFCTCVPLIAYPEYSYKAFQCVCVYMRRPYLASKPASRLISSRRASVSFFDALAAANCIFFFRSSSSLTTIQTDILSVCPLCSNLRHYSLGLSDFEYSFSLVTKSLNSCCLSSLPSRLFLRSSGLYLDRSSSSLGVNHMVKAGPPTATAAPLHPGVNFRSRLAIDGD
jgi:hypothetical protein